MPSDNEMDVDDESQMEAPFKDYEAREKELDEKYPNRPRNHSQTLPFHTLFQDLFDPLHQNKNRKTQVTINQRKLGPSSTNSQSPHEIRRAIIERYISRWRKEVGNDFFPVFRLIMPDKDRERSMYGMKEKTIGRMLVKIMKIDKKSDDGYNLINWKQPGRSSDAKNTGNFPERAREVLSKRPFRTEVGDMSIEEVNTLLDELAAAPKEENQLPIMEQFYRRMNPDELKWLICIILRVMHVGATEKTFFQIYHPDADALFNVSSSLRRVCWELWSPNVRLEGEDRGVNLWQCFQPQLAQSPLQNFKLLPSKMRVTEEDPEFWIEEKLDGERMQMHMRINKEELNKMEFKFWSRKAKEYTYLYGDSIEDQNGSLTRHLEHAFSDGVENIILDGEMITWDPESDTIVPFGTLKTAALEQQRNQYSVGPRPLYRVFDILYLNDKPLTRYTLRDRRRALERSIEPVDRWFEIIEYKIGHTAEDVEKALEKVIEEASEGLVIKNPRSAYSLNDRNQDWIKVKPEYLDEYGESLDLLIIGGYYGSGGRGGKLSSYLCGLRVDDSKDGNKSQKFLSFCKSGGGANTNEHTEIRHHTDGKWIDWDQHKPPTDYIELAGGVHFQRERPDVWIKPPDSFVIQVKAASVNSSDQFATNTTLRFPRFQRMRFDKDWTTCLSVSTFNELREQVEEMREKSAKDKKIEFEKRRGRQRVERKKQLHVAGYSAKEVNQAVRYAVEKGDVFRGCTMYVMTESTKPEKKTKVELEEMIKAHGGKVVQTADAVPNTICIAGRNTVKVASLRKTGTHSIFKPMWLFDCIKQGRIDFADGMKEMPLRPEMERHVFFTPEDKKHMYEMEVDKYGDSFGRDISTEELKDLFANMGVVEVLEDHRTMEHFREMVGETPGWMFAGTKICFDGETDTDVMKVDGADADKPQPGNARLHEATEMAQFGGATTTTDLNDASVSHIVVNQHSNTKNIRKKISTRRRLPRIVTVDWVEDSWKEKTRLDEEKYVPL